MKRVLHVVGGMNRAGAETMLMNLGRIFRIKNSNPISRTFKLFRLIKKESPFHAVHCHMLFSNAFHVLAAYFANIKMRISHSHNTSDVNSNTFYGRVYQNASRIMIKRLSTHFIGCGDAASKFLFPNNDKVKHLFNAIDVEEFSNNRIENRNFLKKEFNLNGDTIVITQIGRISPVKNHEFTINFAEYLVQKGRKFIVVIAGSGPLENKLLRIIKEKKLDDYIKFLGIRSDIPNILAGTDVMIMPSYHEGFPVVLVESQATGVTSLISTNISPEVDMGLKLVTLINLEDDFSIWETKFLEVLNQREVSSAERLEVLSNKGFNINESIKKLEHIYG